MLNVRACVHACVEEGGWGMAVGAFTRTVGEVLLNLRGVVVLHVREHLDVEA